MAGRSGGKRPSLTRAETIDSCNSEDLVTVLEVPERRPYKIMDRSRELKKGVMAESLFELIERGKKMLNYPQEKKVYVVLEEDGTEVDEEEYFQTLPENTLLMILLIGDKWSPFGPPFTFYSEKLENEVSSTSSLLMLTLEKLIEDPNFFAKSEILSLHGFDEEEEEEIEEIDCEGHDPDDPRDLEEQQDPEVIRKCFPGEGSSYIAAS